MRRLLRVLMYVGLGLVVLVAGGIAAMFALALANRDLDPESKAYVEDAVVAITTKWNKAELIQRAAPALRDSLKPDDWDNLFAAFASLGRLIEYQGAEGQAHIAATLGTGTQISAKYVARARYEKGPAEIQVVLIKGDDDWKIIAFHVNSPALMESLVGRKS